MVLRWTDIHHIHFNIACYCNKSRGKTVHVGYIQRYVNMCTYYYYVYILLTQRAIHVHL